MNALLGALGGAHASPCPVGDGMEGPAAPARALLALALALVPMAASGAEGGEAAEASAPALLEQADAHRDAGRLEAQLKAARQAREAAPESAEALALLARAHYDLGNAAEGEARTRHLERAVRSARRAVEAAPDRAVGHVWLGITLGELALTKGGAEKLELSREIRRAAERALEIDPERADALLVLARWHYEVETLSWWERMGVSALGGLPETSLEEAARLLERATRLEPETIRYRLLLARVHLGAGLEGAARKELERSLALPEKDLADAERKAEARELLAGL